MRVEWTAREIHPWDRGLDRQLREQLFAQQCLRDVDAAVNRIFDEVPEIDALEVHVLHDGSPLLEGLVRKTDLASLRHGSPRMNLKSLGIRFQMSNGRLEPLSCPRVEGAA